MTNPSNLSPLVNTSPSTKLLTWAELEQHAAAGILMSWLGGFAEIPSDGRALYMTREVYEKYQVAPWPVTMPQTPRGMKERRTAMKAVLRRYVGGGHMNIRYDLKELGSENVNTDMQGFWEFRSGPPVEQTRLFGFFARPGAFVATSFRARGELEASGDQAAHDPWLNERVSAESTWQTMFPNRRYMREPWPAITQDSLYPYVDNAHES